MCKMSHCQLFAVWQGHVILGYFAAIANVLRMRKVFSVKQAWLSLQALLHNRPTCMLHR